MLPAIISLYAFNKQISNLSNPKSYFENRDIRYEKFNIGDFYYVMLRNIPSTKVDDLSNIILKGNPCKTKIYLTNLINCHIGAWNIWNT